MIKILIEFSNVSFYFIEIIRNLTRIQTGVFRLGITFVIIKEVGGTRIDFVDVFETGPDKSAQSPILMKGTKAFPLIFKVLLKFWSEVWCRLEFGILSFVF